MRIRPRTDGGVRMGVYAAAVSVLTLGVLGACAAGFSEPLLFPSLGPTVMVLAERPRSASAHPRNVVVGHVVGIAGGLLGLLVFGLVHHRSVLVEGVGAARIGAAVLSVAVTTFVLQILRAPHAPAGATTLIVSLGLLTSAHDLLAMLVAVAFVTAAATGLNLATGARLHLRGSRDDTPREIRRTRPSRRDTPSGRSTAPVPHHPPGR